MRGRSVRGLSPVTRTTCSASHLRATSRWRPRTSSSSPRKAATPSLCARSTRTSFAGSTEVARTTRDRPLRDETRSSRCSRRGFPASGAMAFPGHREDRILAETTMRTELFKEVLGQRLPGSDVPTGLSPQETRRLVGRNSGLTAEERDFVPRQGLAFLELGAAQNGSAHEAVVAGSARSRRKLRASEGPLRIADQLHHRGEGIFLESRLVVEPFRPAVQGDVFLHEVGSEGDGERRKCYGHGGAAVDVVEKANRKPERAL